MTSASPSASAPSEKRARSEGRDWADMMSAGVTLINMAYDKDVANLRAKTQAIEEAQKSLKYCDSVAKTADPAALAAVASLREMVASVATATAATTSPISTGEEKELARRGLALVRAAMDQLGVASESATAE